MSARSKYIILSGTVNFLDFTLDYQGASLLGSDISVVGTSSIDILYVRPGMNVDFGASGGGVDKVYLSGNKEDYQYGVLGNFLQLNRVIAGVTESVRVAAPSIGSDLLIFANGSMSAFDIKQSLNNPNATVVALDAKETSASLPLSVASNTRITAIASDPSVFTAVLPNVELALTGSSGVDTVYVKPGTHVDASNLGGGNDVIYLTGSWADYEKEIHGTKITFSKKDNIGQVIESVSISASAGGMNDQVYFSDGKVDSYNIRSAILVAISNAETSEDVEILDVSGVDVVAKSPGLGDLVTMSSTVQSLSCQQTAQITLSFLETVTALSLSDFVVSHGTLSQLTQGADNKTWHVIYTPDNQVEANAMIGMLPQYRTPTGALPLLMIAVDTKLPELTMSAVTSDNQINKSEAAQGITLSGSAGIGDIVKMSFSTEANAQNLIVNAQGKWQYTLSTAQMNQLSQGQNDLSFWMTDIAGNTSQKTQTIHVDTVDPSLSASFDSTTGDLIWYEQATVLNGSVGTDADLTAWIDTTDYSHKLQVQNGNWQLSLSLADIQSLGEGFYSLSLIAQDEAGNQSVINRKVEIDYKPLLTISSTLDDINNLDPMSDLVLQASEAVQAVSGKFIRVVDDGGNGYAGEASDHTQVLDVTDTQVVQIVGQMIHILPPFNLDLASSYHIEIDAGAFISQTSGMASEAINDAGVLNFSTVTPHGGAGTSPNDAVLSAYMDEQGSLIDGYKWWDIRGVGSGDSGYSAGNFSLAQTSIVMVFKDYDPNPIDPDTGIGIAVGNPSFNFGVIDFGQDDLLYIDDQTNDVTKVNDLFLIGGIHNGYAPTTLMFDGYQGIPDSEKKGPGLMNISIEGSTLGFDDYLAWVQLVGATPIVSA